MVQGNITNLELGGAIYLGLRNIEYIPDQWESNHWHTGVFNYFRYSNGKGHLYFTEMQNKKNTKQEFSI